jgi:hypothetical protein
VTIPSGLAAELELLAQALDLPDFTLVEFLSRLIADSQAAVDSYLGLSVSIAAHRSHFDLTVLDEGSIPDDIRASVLVPLSAAVNDSTIARSVALTPQVAAVGSYVRGGPRGKRRRRGVGAIANDLGLNPSTVGRVRERHDLPHPGYGRPDHRRRGIWERGTARIRYEHKLPAR